MSNDELFIVALVITFFVILILNLLISFMVI